MARWEMNEEVYKSVYEWDKEVGIGARGNGIEVIKCSWGLGVAISETENMYGRWQTTYLTSIAKIAKNAIDC